MCDTPGIPKELHMGSREKDNSFTVEQVIYRRFKENSNPELWEDRNDLASNVFPLDNDSYNWSKYSLEPEDVLFNINAKEEKDHFFNWGIISISCFSVMGEQFSATIEKQLVVFKMHLEHQPEDCMYPHAEMLIADAFTNAIVPNRPRMIKTAIRRHLVKNKVILKMPSF